MSKSARIDLCIGLALAVSYFAVMLATVEKVGFVRDEGYYFKASGDYLGWFDELWSNVKIGKPGRSLSKANIDRWWSYNHEHPALMKEFFGFSWQVFSQKLHLVRNSTGFRLPGMFFGGLALALLYLFGAQAFNRRVGLFAALALGTVPRFFFHAHLACFDVPIATMTLFTVYAFWLSAGDRRWGRGRLRLGKRPGEDDQQQGEKGELRVGHGSLRWHGEQGQRKQPP